MGFSGGASVSWCKLEYVVDDYRTISLYRENCILENSKILIPTTPPLTTLTLMIKTMLNTKTQEHEIVTACGFTSSKFYMDKATTNSSAKSDGSKSLYDSYFCALTKPATGKTFLLKPILYRVVFFYSDKAVSYAIFTENLCTFY